MCNIELIIGNHHGGRTTELITKYYNFCTGNTDIKKVYEKTFKKYEMIKPYFIHFEEEVQVLKNFIKNIDKDFNMELFNTISSASTDTGFLDELLKEDGDKVLFIDFNLTLEELNYFLKDFFYKTNGNGYNYNLFISVTQPKFLKEVIKDDKR